MTEADIEQIENELGVELPKEYSAWLLSLPTEFDDRSAKLAWEKVGHVFLTPESVIRPTLQLVGTDMLKDTEWEDVELSEYLAIGGDGCGNLYLIDPDDEDSPVHFLCHDPLGFQEDYLASVSDYCDAVNQAIQ